MTKKEESEVTEEVKNEELREEIRQMDKIWYKQPWFVILSLILSVATFLGGFFVEFDAILQSALQTILFIFSAGFFVIVLSFMFNKAWLYSLKEKTGRDYMLSLLLQLVSMLAFLVNLILMSLRFTTNFFLSNVKGAFWYVYHRGNYDVLMNKDFPWSHEFSGEKFYFQYHLGIEYSQTFTILIVIFAVVIVVLGITSFRTYKKLKKSPFNVKNHLIYLLHPVLVFYYGSLVLYELILKKFTGKEVTIKKLKAYHNLKRAALFMLVPILFAALFFAFYALTNHSMWILLELYWPFYF